MRLERSDEEMGREALVETVKSEATQGLGDQGEGTIIEAMGKEGSGLSYLCKG